MSTEILAAGTSEAASADIVVAAGAPVNVFLFHAGEGNVDVNCTCPVFIQKPDLSWAATTWSLSRDNPTRIIVGAGTYQIRRGGNIETATGIATG